MKANTLPICSKSSFIFTAVRALVSVNIALISSAYSFASETKHVVNIFLILKTKKLHQSWSECILKMSRVMRKLDFCLCENKGVDQLHSNCEADQQLRSNCEADQHLCFRYTDSTIPLPLKSEISSFYPSSVAAHAGSCRTWSETPKTSFLALLLILRCIMRKHCILHRRNTCKLQNSWVVCR